MRAHSVVWLAMASFGAGTVMHDALQAVSSFGHAMIHDCCGDMDTEVEVDGSSIVVEAEIIEVIDEVVVTVVPS